MPTLKRATQRFKPDEIVVAWESFVGDDICVVAGTTRLRGDHPIVKRCPTFFVQDGTPSDEITRLRQAYYVEKEPPPPVDPGRTTIAKEIRDEDAVVCTRGLLAGTRVHRKSKAATNAPTGTYAPVMPDPAVDRQDALVALETMRVLGEGGRVERIVYAGQLVHRDDEFVQIHPHAFGMPQVQGREEA